MEEINVNNELNEVVEDVIANTSGSGKMLKVTAGAGLLALAGVVVYKVVAKRKAKKSVAEDVKTNIEVEPVSVDSEN